jgi:hypothetical protein
MFFDLSCVFFVYSSRCRFVETSTVTTGASCHCCISSHPVFVVVVDPSNHSSAVWAFVFKLDGHLVWFLSMVYLYSIVSVSGICFPDLFRLLLADYTRRYTMDFRAICPWTSSYWVGFEPITVLLEHPFDRCYAVGTSVFEFYWHLYLISGGRHPRASRGSTPRFVQE